MCGICGKINLATNVGVDTLTVKTMASILIHRGPDAEGYYNDEHASLGQRRLSIIDLSSAGSQPMSNEDKSLWLACNGEIYNFKELRAELSAKGHIFCSRSDSEVILHLYEEKGDALLNSLRGMFAFCLWDKRRQRLLLARDRAGKKPLYYSFKNGSLAFASEIRSLLQDRAIGRSIDQDALDLYLTFGYIPAPWTIFQEIKKLPPASILIWEKDREPRINKYWGLDYSQKQKGRESEISERLIHVLEEAVKVRLESDVPLGAFLSGGIDSSAVVAMMSRLSPAPVKTFSIGFTESSFNELAYARKVAKIFATEHHEYMVEPRALEALPELTRNFGEPFADSSAIPSYYLSKLTRGAVTVALNGDGGDESFAGYERYAALRLARYFNFPARIISPLAKILPETTGKKDLGRNLKKFLRGAALPEETRYAYWMSIFDRESRNRLYSAEFNDLLKGHRPEDYLLSAYRDSGTKDPCDAILAADIATYLPGDLLVKMDVASMSHSLEVRSPFLDHKLMEFAASIPTELKLKGMTTKYILKKALEKILPREVLYRPKQGFGVPVGKWFKNELKDYAYDILLSPRSLKRGYFKPGEVRRLLEEHIQGRIDHGARLWSLLCLEAWQREFTPTPESHGCKPVDEWLSGSGFRPPKGRRNTEGKDAAAVKPRSFTDPV